jgi:hypothetical protein
MSFSSLFESGGSARNKSHFATIVALAQCSGIKEEETIQLLRFKQLLDISDADYVKIMDHHHSYPVTPPNTSEERLQWLHDLFKIAFADNVMDEKEYVLLRKYATALGYNEADAEYLVARSIEIFNGHLNLDDYRYLLNKNR